MTAAPTDLLALRNADTIGDVDGIAARALGRLVGARLADLGYRQHEDPDEGTLRVYRVGMSARHVNLSEFRSRVLADVEDLLDETIAGRSGERGIRRAVATKRTLRDGARGARSWERLAVEHARDTLPEAATDEVDAAEIAARASRAARASERAAERVAAEGTPRERERAARATSRADQRAAAEIEVRARLVKWLPIAIDDSTLVGDLWEAWRDAVRDSPSFRAEHPSAAAIGRTTFYRIALDLLDVRSLGGRRRIVSVPYGLRVRDLLRRRALVAALRLQAERFALDRTAPSLSSHSPHL